MTPRKFRKKPVEVEAVRLTTENAHEVAGWCGGAVRPNMMNLTPFEVDLRTNNGWVEAKMGDYIVKSPLGDFYPCSADVFEACHEPVPPTEEEIGRTID